MDIGGIDIWFNYADHKKFITAAYEASREIWPKLFLEHMDASEVFIFKDRTSFEAWGSGPYEDFHNTMIHVVCNKGCTVVVDDKDHPDNQHVLTALETLL